MHTPPSSPTPRTPSPPHSTDPSAYWESQIRQRWLSPRSSSAPPPPPSPPEASPSTSTSASTCDARPPPSESKKPKDPLFQERIAMLEQMLRAANSAPASASSLAGRAVPPPLAALSVPAADASGSGGAESRGLVVPGHGQAAEDQDGLDEEPDGGCAIRGAGEAGKGTAQELKKVSEGIFLAFKQGRPLKESLPLSLVTSLLYRSWTLDGTIPSNYVPSLADPDPPMPTPLSFSADTPTFPSPLALLSQVNSSAVTPLPSNSDDLPPTPTDAPPPPPAAAAPSPTVSPATPLKPVLSPLQPRAGSGASPAPSLEGMGADTGSGKLKLDVLRGSRWRTERDVASGSDVI
ncbi:hypothetical protein JCM21900_002285 [Sporobolomyces salmonicolor]